MRPSLGQVPLLEFVGLVALLVFSVRLQKLWVQGQRVAVRRRCAIALLTWVFGVLLMTLPSLGRHDQPLRFNLLPFRNHETTVEILGNLLLFVPGGILLAIGWHWLTSPRGVLLGGAGFSLFIEVNQAFLRGGRAADITDVLLNTLGMTVGYLIAVAWVKTWRQPVLRRNPGGTRRPAPKSPARPHQHGPYRPRTARPRPAPADSRRYGTF